MRIKKLIMLTHRDVGYFFAGMTVIYAISGIAVNHFGDWNPNYSSDSSQSELGELPSDAKTSELVDQVLTRMEITDTPRSAVRMAPTLLRIFFEGRTISVKIPEGTVTDERVSRRPALYEINYLHLNHGKGFWTWFADLYAIGLLTLALTGIFIIRGKKGLRGRGGLLVLAGSIPPVLFVLFKVWLR